MGSFDPHPHQITVRRWNGPVILGIGWDYGKEANGKPIFFGLHPRYSSKHFKMTMTLKQNYIPWSIWLGKDFSLEPLTTGIYFNTVFSDDFWTSEPERYPRGYYGFSTRIRTHIFLGQRVRFDVPEKYRKFSKSITAFYESAHAIIRCQCVQQQLFETR